MNLNTISPAAAPVAVPSPTPAPAPVASAPVSAPKPVSPPLAPSGVAPAPKSRKAPGGKKAKQAPAMAKV